MLNSSQADTKKPRAWKPSPRQRNSKQLDGNLDALAVKLSQYFLENGYESGSQLRVILNGIVEELKNLRQILRSLDGPLKSPSNSKLSDCNAKDSPVKCLVQEIQLRLIDTDQNRNSLSRFDMWKKFASTSPRGFPARVEKQKWKIVFSVRFEYSML